MNRFTFKLYIIGFGILSLLLRIIAGLFPAWTESLYSRGLYVYIRKIADATITRLPVPWMYVFFIVLIIFIIYKIKNTSIRNYKIQYKNWFLNILAFIGFALSYFLWSWGFNYARVPVADHLKLDLQPMDSTQMLVELEAVRLRALEARKQIPGATEAALNWGHISTDLEELSRIELEKQLQKYGYPTPGKVNIRMLFPKGSLLRNNTSGIYFPFVFEGHVDPGLHPLQQGFTIPHELAHGYGFGDEGTCNFWAYVTCVESGNPFLTYCGELAYRNYLLREIWKRHPYTFKKCIETIPIEIKNDRDAIKAEMKKYPDWLPGVQEIAYDAYLRTQGVSAGIDSYNEVVILVDAWRRKNIK